MKKFWALASVLVLTGCAVFIPMKVGPPPDIKVEITPERVELGTKLAEGILACGSCHTTGNFAGEPRQDMFLAGDVFIGKFEGTITSANITPDKETGIGDWSDGEIIRALTRGINKDGEQLVPFMPWPVFGAALTEEEIYSIVAYLRTVPEPVKNKVGENKLTKPLSVMKSTGMMYNMYMKAFGDYVPRTDTPVERGKRLAYMGACVDCHAYAEKFPFPGPKFGGPLAGGIEIHLPDGRVVICSNLTPHETGIGGFTDQQLYDAIKYGKRLRPLPETEMVRWPMMARIPNHTSLTDEEIYDLIAFLKSQEPIEHDILKKEDELAQKD